MINVKAKRCKDCNKLASFNYKNISAAMYCSEHALIDMISICKILCIIKDCPKTAYYNFKEKTERLYCKDHKDSLMIDITHKNKICIEEKCTIQSSFNFENEINPLYCKKHSKEGMEDIMSKRCLHINCKLKPSFNYENEKLPIYCLDHSLPNMINIYAPICIYPNCTIYPSYNYKGLKERLYCSKHALENMIDVINKRCIYEGCETIPKYNLPGEKVLYCGKHKLENMVNLYPIYCIEDNCTTIRSFNYKNLKPRYCLKHKKEDMVNVVDPLCKECDKIASYNYPECTERFYCSLHKRIGMINLYGTKCKSDFCLTGVNNKNRYNGYCLHCFTNLFPDEPRTINYCTKEKIIVKYVLDNFPDYTWINNKIIQDGCSKRRPDMLVDLGSHVLIIEIDEFQHILYDSQCENNRLEDISKDLYYRPIVIIRFNPDEYIDENNNKINSPWIYNNSKIGIDINCIDDWNNRLNELKNKINYYLQNNNNEERVEIIKLYYDYEET